MELHGFLLSFPVKWLLLRSGNPSIILLSSLHNALKQLKTNCALPSSVEVQEISASQLE